MIQIQVLLSSWGEDKEEHRLHKKVSSLIPETTQKKGNHRSPHSVFVIKRLASVWPSQRGPISERKREVVSFKWRGVIRWEAEVSPAASYSLRSGRSLKTKGIIINIISLHILKEGCNSSHHLIQQTSSWDVLSLNPLMEKTPKGDVRDHQEKREPSMIPQLLLNSSILVYLWRPDRSFQSPNPGKVSRDNDTRVSIIINFQKWTMKSHHNTRQYHFRSYSAFREKKCSMKLLAEHEAELASRRS